MMKSTILLKYTLAGLFIACFSQNSWSSMDSDQEQSIGDKHPSHDSVVHPAPPVQAGDPAQVLREKAHKGAQKAKKRLGLNKPEKEGRPKK